MRPALGRPQPLIQSETYRPPSTPYSHVGGQQVIDDAVVLQVALRDRLAVVADQLEAWRRCGLFSSDQMPLLPGPPRKSQRKKWLS